MTKDQEDNMEKDRMLVNEFTLSREINEAFVGDDFERKNLAVHLMNYVGKVKNGAVIAIDAPWGEGKTWFGIHLEKYLKDTQGHKTIFIDAFKQDYIEDPFLLIAAEINNLAKAEDPLREDLKKGATGVLKNLAPLALKVAINSAGMLVPEVASLDWTVFPIS